MRAVTEVVARRYIEVKSSKVNMKKELLDFAYK